MYKKIIDARIFPQLIISKNNFTSSMHVEYGAKSKLITPPSFHSPPFVLFPAVNLFRPFSALHKSPIRESLFFLLLSLLANNELVDFLLGVHNEVIKKNGRIIDLVVYFCLIITNSIKIIK
jgi:hypothetical protein